jgi:hypothetical protein
MTDKAAFSGSYSDFKLVKTRSVAQVIVEIPVEAAESFIKVFGMPIPGSEKPVAIALLGTAPEKPKTAEQELGEQIRTRAVLLCKEPAFQQWLQVAGEDDARDYLCEMLDIKSRSALARNQKAQREFVRIENRYLTATAGQPR